MELQPLRSTVTSAEFVRHFGSWQDLAATRPVFVTHHGRERLVILSVPNYTKLMERAADGDRQTMHPDEMRLGAVLERIGEGFLTVDAQSVVTEINPAASSYLKVARGQALGSALTDLFPTLTRTAFWVHLSRAIQSGEVGAFDQPSFTFEGRWLRMQTMPYLDGAACLFRDITHERQQRRQAETDAATSAAMIAHGGVGRARLSARGTFTHICPVLAHMAGFEPDALARARFTDILPLSRRIEATQHIEAALSGEEPVVFSTSLMVNRDGERPVRVAIAPMRGEHGTDGAVVIVTPEMAPIEPV